MLIFISGGVRSGKSSLGEDLAISMAKQNRKIYLATSRYYDNEMVERIRIHQQKRAEKGFITIDKSSDIGDVLTQLKKEDIVLLDCLGTLLANEMFDGADRSAEGEHVRDKIFTDLMNIKDKVLNFIIVSNEVFSDGIQYDESTETYIKILADLHIMLVKTSDIAIECLYGGYQCHKGTLILSEKIRLE